MEPESGMPVMLIVFTLFMLTLMQAFLVLSQSAIFNADTIILRKMAENRNKRSLRILKMISEPRITTMHLRLSVALAFSIYAVTYHAFSPPHQAAAKRRPAAALSPQRTFRGHHFCAALSILPLFRHFSPAPHRHLPRRPHCQSNLRRLPRHLRAALPHHMGAARRNNTTLPCCRRLAKRPQTRRYRRTHSNHGQPR